jgi:hypothetical protein
MKQTLVRVGSGTNRHIVNVEHVADAKWEGESLYVHFHGGSFAQFRGLHAELIWRAIDAHAINLETGEAPPEA